MFFVLCISFPVLGQDTKGPKSLPEAKIAVQAKQDSIRLNLLDLDTVPKVIDPFTSNINGSDTLRNPVRNVPEVKISKDAITDLIKYGARDSSWIDMKLKEIHLYGSAYVEYQKTKIKAGYIVINFDKSIAKAFAVKDENGRYKDNPSFEDGETKAGFRELAYNFKSKKAFVKEMSTKQGEFNVIGEKSKYIAKENDTIYHEDVFYNRGAIITTCDHNPPHYGIRASKLKFIPDRLAVAGPSQLQIAGIPTPIILPFGLYPLVAGASSGLIFPKLFDYSENNGFSFRGIGYYFPINDYVDLRVTGDIYLRGSFSARVNSNYKKRYKYTGSINLGYSNQLTEDRNGKVTSAKSFSIQLAHTQDTKAHPFRTLGGSINFTTNKYDQRTYNDANSVLNNSTSSNFTYGYRWPDSPFKFSMSFNHNQNTQTRDVNITLPQASLNMNTIFPLKRKNQIGGERWYENIGLVYNAQLKNFVKTKDTLVFTSQTLKDLQSGFSHNAILNTSFRALKYISVTPSLSYEEILFLRTLQKDFDPTTINKNDTTGMSANGEPIIVTRSTYGTVKESFKTGLESFRSYNASISLNTQLFATKTFKRGWLRGIRHIMKPSASFSYKPDTYNKYIEYVDTDTRPEQNKPMQYNPFSGGVFSAPLSERTSSLNFSIQNVFEAKYRGKKDTVDHKLKLFENLLLNGGYNFAADSIHWSDFSLSANTLLFNNITNLTFRAQYTPYVLKNGSIRTNETLWSKEKKLIQLHNMNTTLTSNFSLRQIADIFTGKNKKNQANAAGPFSQTQGTQLNSNFDQITVADTLSKPAKKKLPSMFSLVENFRVSHNIQFGIMKNSANRDTFLISVHSIQLQGGIRLSDNWTISISNIAYDLKNHSLVYPSFGFQRDLHCWKMEFTWAPSRELYGFFIGVKSSSLSFLKYNYGEPGFGGFSSPF